MQALGRLASARGPLTITFLVGRVLSGLDSRIVAQGILRIFGAWHFHPVRQRTRAHRYLCFPFSYLACNALNGHKVIFEVRVSTVAHSYDFKYHSKPNCFAILSES